VSDEDRLIVFVKLPMEGSVKTRLAQTVGPETAVLLYRCFVSDTLALIRRSGYSALIGFHPPNAHNAVKDWLGEGLEYFPQEGNDLGERMFAAFQKAFLCCTRAVLVGSDCPDLPIDFLYEAFEYLKTHDAVLGPAVDGGYYLIGFSARGILEAPFKGIQWESPGVFKDTMTVLRKNRLKVHVLPSWNDVDEYDDLKALFARQKALPPNRLTTIDFLLDHLGW